MANYGVDIEVALKGVEKLRQFDKLLSHSVEELNKLEKALKAVNKQNPYDVTGARRVTELDKKRTDYIRQQNRLLSDQERLRSKIASETARASLADQAAARRAGITGVQRRPIAGVAYPQGAGPGEGPQAAFNRQMAHERQAALGRRRVNDIKQATRFLEIDLINKQIQLEVDGIERIGKKQAENNKTWLKDFDARLRARQEEKDEALKIAKIEADAATKRRKDAQQLVTARSKQRKEALGSALIGGAFPLLFGQGVGAAAGGALGGGLGGLAGGQLGFGLSLVGTALGSLFDQLANNAKEAAKSLRDPITNFQAIKSAAILASGAQERYLETLIKTGQYAKTNAAIQEEITKKIGTEGVKDLNNLDVANTKFLRTLGELGLQLSGFVAGPLAAFLSSINEGLSVFTRANRASAESRSFLERLPADKRAEFLQRNIQLGNQLGFASAEERDRRIAALRSEFEPFATPIPAAELTAEAQQQQKIYAGTTAEMQKQAQLAEKQLVIAQQNGTVSAAARSLAAQAANDLDYEIAKLGIKNQMLREGFDLERNQALHRQAALNHQAQQAAILEQQRQQEIADAQQRISLAVQENQLSAQAHSLNEQIVSLGVTEEKAIENKLVALKSEHAFQQQALEFEQQAVMLSDEYQKNQAQINRNHELQLENLRRQQNFEVASLMRQREALALARMQATHAQQLQAAQTEAGFQGQLAGAGINPFVGPFGESARAEQQMALDFALDLNNKQLEIQQIRDQIAATTDQKEIENLTKRREGLEKLLALHQQYVPQINAAALEQQRFNEALQFTQPVVDGVFQSLTAVADGTKTAQQAFADFLNNIANMLADVAMQIIATYVAIGIARSFAGVPAQKSGTDKHLADLSGAMKQYNFDFGGGMASGGRVSGGTSYLVGENGPELFTPGASGTITPNSALGGATINVSVDASGSSVQGNQPDAAQLGRAIGAAVQAELVKQKRPGGLLA